MRSRENYTPYVIVSFILTLGILLLFQAFILSEPGRIVKDEKRDELIAVTVGRGIYAENCAMCHGEQGEGVDAPPLNDKTFLNNTSNETVFSLISSGVPSSEMPAWSQVHGGPFTTEEISQIVTFMRSWEADAPDRQALAMEGDPINGLALFSNTCIVCHGVNGQGTSNAPSLNDPSNLSRLDDQWYMDTIADGRPAQGMPTWGTVLSPGQISDLVALLRVWERGETVELPGPEKALSEALHMLEHGDLHEAEHALGEAAEGAFGEVLAAINEAIAAIEAGDLTAAEAAIHLAEELLGIDGIDADEHSSVETDEHN